ncbi:MAG: methylmalonyl Co-A mutase-associated GTPase MeaB [Candidatus Rokubacteria bacterium]|nr:methylmalonyl Co-A mutase-associated GTPase MeaB [Candidatus Rokubacteria bacterium]
MEIPELVERMLEGDRLALARLITQVENRSPAVPEVMRRVHGRTGRAYVVGITGPPGSGKSTLVDCLTALLRAEGVSVGIIAVDPSSPFSGGAVLGDRIRMQSHAEDPEVFIRSMATRGSLGGLTRATGDVIRLLDAFGKQWVLIETVGVGQTELDIMRQADTTVVVLVPESGDAIQTMKAGLLEVADIFVVNKADRDGAGPLVSELRFMAHLQRSSPHAPKDIEWESPALATEAQHGVGVEELLRDIRKHRELLEHSGALEKRRKARRRSDLQALLIEEIRQRVSRQLASNGALAATLEQVADGRLDPYSAVEQILASLERESS